MIWRRRRPANPEPFILRQAGPAEAADQPTVEPAKPAEEPTDPRDTPQAAKTAMDRVKWLTDNPEKMTLEEMRAFLGATRAAVNGVEAFMGEVRDLASHVGGARPVLEAVPDRRDEGGEDDDGPCPTCGRSA